MALVPDEFITAVGIWPLLQGKLDEMGIWLDENTTGDWVYQLGQIHFTEREDAVFFRLRFGV